MRVAKSLLGSPGKTQNMSFGYSNHRELAATFNSNHDRLIFADYDEQASFNLLYFPFRFIW